MPLFSLFSISFSPASLFSKAHMTDRGEDTRKLIVTRAQVGLKIRNWAQKA